jgi:hypothetical protein
MVEIVLEDMEIMDSIHNIFEKNCTNNTVNQNSTPHSVFLEE